jgi:hypothetical protein
MDRPAAAGHERFHARLSDSSMLAVAIIGAGAMLSLAFALFRSIDPIMS